MNERIATAMTPPAECLLRQKLSIHSCKGCMSLPALVTAEPICDAPARRPRVSLTAFKQFN